ncbi:MAG: tetratricopeptide repeat protein [Candidatus Natronoplasma sp.]
MECRVKGKERILLHLLDVEERNLRDDSSSYSFPFALSQEGIADAVGFSRNKSGKLLKELEKEKLIRRESNRVPGGRQRKFVYFLTGKGRVRSEDIRERFEEKTVSIRTDDGVFETELKDIDEHVKGPGNLLFVLKHLDSNDQADLRDLGKDRPFVDRKEELRWLRKRINLLSEGENKDENVILFTGPSGIGKTRMVEEIEGYAEQKGVAFIQGRCYEDTMDMIEPVRDGFSKIYDELRESKGLEVNKPEIFDQLDKKIEKIRTSGENLSTEKEMLFHEMKEGIEKIAEEIPLLLFMDDMHWANNVTLENLDFLAENLERGNVLIIGAYRKDEVRSGIKERFEELKDSDHCVVKDVKSFGWRETRKLIIYRTGRMNVPDGFIDICQDVSGGFPLFLDAFIDEMLETGELDPVKGRFPSSKEEIDLPQKVKELYHQKVDRLGAAEKKALEICSYFKKEIPLELVRVLIDEKEKLDDSIEKLKDTNLIEVDLSGDVNFSNDLIRQVIKEEVLDGRKKTHQRIVEGLLEVYEDEIEEHHSEIGRHHEKAENYEEAMEYYMKAGEKAEEVYAVEDALNFYKEALSIQKYVSDPDIDSSLLFEKLGDLEVERGQIKKGEKYLHKAFKKIDCLIDKQRLSRKIAETLRKTGEFDEALEFVDSSLDMIEKRGTEDERLEKERCKTLKEKGIILMRKNDFEASERTFKEIMNSCREINRKTEVELERNEVDEVRGEALHYLGSIEFYRANFDKAEGYLQQAIRIKRSIDDLNGVAKSRNNLGVIYRHTQRYDLALDHFKEANRLKRKTGLESGDPDALANIGIIYNDKGELDRSLEYHKKCLNIEKKIGDKRGMAATFGNMGVIYFDKGEMDRAIDHFNRSLRLKEEQGDKHGMGLSYYNLGRSYREKGELDKGMVYLKKSLKIREDYELKQEMAESEMEIGIIHLERGELEKADEYLNDALEVLRDVENEYGMGMALSYIGKLNLLRGEMKKAKLYVNHSDNIGENFDDIEYDIANHRHQAEVYFENDDLEKAHEHAKEALRLSTQIGAKNHMGKCRHLIGYIYLNENHWYQAREGFRKAFGLFEEIGNEKEKAKVLFDWSSLLKKIGDEEEALEKLERSAELFERCGIERWCAMARDTTYSDILKELDKE